VNRELLREVWSRAARRCEYCLLPAAAYPLPFHVDHIVARQHGGQTESANLALACLHCNRHKGPNIAGRDDWTGELVRLFNPRHDRWDQHFEWEGTNLLGKTAIGRVTIQVLAMNDPEFRAVRAALLSGA
jgi:hypothetical protein